MTIQEAEEIVHGFGNVIENTEKYFAKPNSLLPCSKGKITLAFYTWAAELIRRKLMTKEIQNTLAISYSQLASFVDDDFAIKINNMSERVDDLSNNSNNEEKMKNFIAEKMILEKYLWGELNDFLYELFHNISPYKKMI